MNTLLCGLGFSLFVSGCINSEFHETSLNVVAKCSGLAVAIVACFIK